MSTEKDREAAKEHRVGLEKVDAIFGGMTNPLRRIYANQYEKSFLAGIQHARQGERERMKRFMRKVINDERGGGDRIKESVINDSIDEFLEQEAKDEQR